MINDYECRIRDFENKTKDYQDGSETFLLSSDLTTILKTMPEDDERLGFFHSRHYAKFFESLGRVCACLPSKKKMTFLSSLARFTEEGIENVIEKHENDIFDDDEYPTTG